jgi:hypothetical protein
MFSQFVWWTANAAEVLLLVRSVQGKFYRKYPTFYFYLGAVLVISLVRFSIFSFRPSFYPIFYWYTEYFAAVIGYAVILEIYAQTVKKYPGAVAVSRVLLLALLAAIISKAIAGSLTSQGWYATETMAALERDMRLLQVMLLVGIIGLLGHYKIPTGRNFQGILVGYSGYVLASIICLPLGSQLDSGTRPGWRQALPLVYLAVLVLWCFTLWSYQPSPEPAENSRIEHDYRLIAERTSRLLSRISSLLKMGGEL